MEEQIILKEGLSERGTCTPLKRGTRGCRFLRKDGGQASLNDRGKDYKKLEEVKSL